jgi:hypothetical protein
VFNFDMDRLMHRHGDHWMEMKPVHDPHSPDDEDPERLMLRGGERVYRCTGCDEEMRVVSPRPPG